MTLRILLTMCGRKGYLARTLRSAGRDLVMVGVDADSDAPARGAFDVFAAVPPVDAAGGAYVEALLGVAEREGVGAVVSVNDLDSALLAAARGRFEQLGCRVMGAELAVARQLDDKRAAFDWLTRRGFGTPATRTLSEVRSGGLTDAATWIAKPRHGQGSRGVVHLSSLDGLAQLPEDTVIQPCLYGRHIDVDLLRDARGTTQVALKEKLDPGEGTAAITLSLVHPALEAEAHRLADAIGHVGLVNADWICTSEVDPPIVLEVNARVGGCFAHACLACDGLAAAFLDVCAGLDAPVAPLQTRPEVRVFRDPHPTIVPSEAS